MRSALSTIRHRIVQSDDALYLTIGQVRERFGGISTMWIVRRMVNASVPRPDRVRATQNPHHGSRSSPTSNNGKRERARISGGAS
jgi:hypothetical protein